MAPAQPVQPAAAVPDGRTANVAAAVAADAVGVLDVDAYVDAPADAPDLLPPFVWQPV